MSHEVYKHDTVTCADGKGTWHGINTRNVPAMDTFESTRLNWPVVQYPLSVVKGDETIQIPDYFVTMRDDISLPLGVVGNQYRIIQNSRVYETVQAIFDGKAKLVTAGSLFNCRQIWFLAALDNGFRIVNRDVYQNYLLASSSHDGSRKLEFRTTSVRVVCNNTLTLAVNRTSDCFEIPHSDCCEVRILQAEKFYDEVFNGIDKTQAVLNLLAERPCDLATAYAWSSGFIKAVSTRSQNISRRIVQLFSEGKGNKGESRYDLLNGVTDRFTHGDENSDVDKVQQFVSSTFGVGSSRKLEALSCLADDEKFARCVEMGRRYNGEYLDSEAAAKSTSLIELSFN